MELLSIFFSRAVGFKLNAPKDDPLKKALLILSSISLVACSVNDKREIHRSAASLLSELPAPELGEVWTQAQDREAEVILDDTLQLLIKDSVGDDYVRRDAHPKTHACVRAKMKIDPSLLPRANQKGIFEKAASYDSWIRFSNGANNGEAKHDLDSDVRGMAIKLMNVPGTPTGTHDFLLANMKEFFSKDGADYTDLVKTASQGSTFDFIRFAATHPISAQRLLAARIKMAHPLQQDFHSAVPFKLGTHSVRYHALPCETRRDPLPGKDAPRDFLRQRLGETLASKGSCFTFYVQLNQNPTVQIVEDPRKSWDEKTSPLIKVADLEIQRQSDVTSKDLVNFCENARFNPWHAHPDNRPLGQINRIRALVYREISKYRHEKNGIAEIEPVNHSPCSGSTAELCRNP